MKKTVLTLLTAAFALFSFSACEKEQNPVPAKPKTNTYVLVHGAWQAPYVWDAVQTDLVNKGNKVIIVELPGHGSDHSLTHTLTLDVYANKVIEAITPIEEKVILVGHSMGGMVVSQVAERIPDKISKLVYIGAFLPKNGQALTDLAFSDPDSHLGPNLIESADHLTLDVNEAELINLFIADGSEAAKQSVRENYRAEPAIPLTNQAVLTTEKFGSVDKVYIKTLQDVVISTGLQDRMIKDAGIKTVYEVNTSHSPFLSQPTVISTLLLKVGL
jgi:Predicted hydrolases or acyltransferases (alpha/beta hydrolase superfamily)